MRSLEYCTAMPKSKLFLLATTGMDLTNINEASHKQNSILYVSSYTKLKNKQSRSIVTEVGLSWGGQ